MTIFNPYFYGGSLKDIVKNTPFIKHVTGIKHGGTIRQYGEVPEPHQMRREYELDFFGLDTETIATGENAGLPKLIGFINGGYEYSYIDYNKPETLEQAVQHLLFWVDKCTERRSKKGKLIRKQRAFAYWREFDAIAIFRLLNEYNKRIKGIDTYADACERYGKISGEWDYKNAEWISKPVVSCRVFHPSLEREVEFGIKQVIRSNIEFYFRLGDESSKIKTVWGYDAQAHWLSGLEKTAKKYIKDWEYSKLDDYSNIDYEKYKNSQVYRERIQEKYPEIDWKLFDNNERYRKYILTSRHVIDWDYFDEADKCKYAKMYKQEVLKSNELDCRATRDLMKIMQSFFIEAFKEANKAKGLSVYPKNMVSAGSLTTFGLSSIIDNDAYNSINWYNQMIDWRRSGHSQETIKNVYDLAIESYSAGLIDTPALGYTPKAATADISSAYPAIMSNLFDLRGSTITEGSNCTWKDVPNPAGRKYVLLRADVYIPQGIFHTLTMKEPLNGVQNARFAGITTQSGTWEEFKWVEMQGGKILKVHHWVAIETKKERSPLAKSIDILWNLRLELKEKYGDGGAERAAKVVMNSLYGKLFEAIPTFYEDPITGKPTWNGFRAGQLFNPLLACYVTAWTRLQLAIASYLVEKNGGKVMLQMTDALYWAGTPDMLPRDYHKVKIGRKYFQTPFTLGGWEFEHGGWREKKTLGFFEQPESIEDLLVLGTGRYEYKKRKGDKVILEQKARGLIMDEVEVPEDAYVEDTDTIENTKKVWTWKELIELAIKNGWKDKNGNPVLFLKQKVLYSPGLAKATGNYHLLCSLQEKELTVVVNKIFPKRVTMVKGRAENIVELEDLIKGIVPTRMVTPEDFMEVVDYGTKFDGTLKELRENYKGKVVEDPEEVKEELEKQRKERKKETDRLNSRKKFERIEQLRKQYERLIGEKVTVRQARRMGLTKLREEITKLGEEPIA